ncbi:condensation domain-containing protein, partial [Bacillus pumilus]|uniref:condensation domain-containing protein n=1 Tax=Bacillus pumilus TaxID=1408 RepID=UPI0011A3489D
MTLKPFDHHPYPFHNLLHHLSLHTHLTPSPIFQLPIPYLTHSLNINLKPLTTQHLILHHTLSKFHLTLHLFQHEHHLSIHVQYNTHLFHQQTIHPYINYYLHLLH